MAKPKSLLINCSCGCNKFKIVDEKIVCAECDKEIKDEKVCFLNSTDKQLPIDIAKFAIESATIGGGVLIGMLIPFAEPFAFTALGSVSKKAGEWLGELFEGKMYDEGTYGEQLSKKFDSVYGKIYKTDKRNTNGIHQSFRNYSDYCRRHYTEVLSLLIEKDLSADIFSEEAIKVIISEENHYPGADNPQILDNVLSVSVELEREYKQVILNDKDLCFRWLIEKRTGTLEEKIDKIIEYLTHPVEKIKLTDAEFEYIRSYNRPLFLEDDSDISLNSVYVDPIVEDNGNNITDEIYNWYEYDNEKILIIKGAAGIGKTSLVSRIIADTYGHSDFKNNLEREKVFPIILRSNIEAFENASSNKTPIAIIKDILDVRSEDIQNSLIILDGFDELCLLAENFNPDLFLEKLSRDLKSKNTKVLITSRPMNEIKEDIQNVEVKSIVWDKEQIIAWCEKFKNASEKDLEKQWCDEFITNYDDLAQNDTDGNKMDIFKAPMILYLACHSNSQISANETVGEFYDDVFRKIASRKHIENDEDCSVFIDNKNDEKENIINWQFTKELAYQMFLHDTLILSDLKLIENAENRTAEVLVKRGIIANKNDLEIDKLKYLAVTHFAKETTNEKGIEFAHKTVYEYFTAVKLYEDYFQLLKTSSSFHKIWNNVFEAFQYKLISNEVWTYFHNLINKHDENNKFDFKHFLNQLYTGFKEEQMYYEVVNEKKYINNIKPLNMDKRMKMVFCNLSWFLTKQGFNCSSYRDIFMYIKPFLSGYGVNCSGWIFNTVKTDEEIDEVKSFALNAVCINKKNIGLVPLWNKVNLSGAYLVDSHLEFVFMKSAFLEGAHLEYAHLEGAYLKGVHLEGAFLNYADLRGVNLEDAILCNSHLEGCDLSRAFLKNVNVNGAFYDDRTVIPDEYKFIVKNMKKNSNSKNNCMMVEERECFLTKKMVSQIVMKLFNIEELNYDENYFHMGLDSIGAISFLYEIQKNFELKYSIADIFKYPTVNLTTVRILNLKRFLKNNK